MNVVCDFGNVRSHGVAKAFVSASVSPRLGQNQSIRVGFALRVGPGAPQPILTGASAKVLASTDASNRGSCRKVPDVPERGVRAADHGTPVALYRRPPT